MTDVVELSSDSETPFFEKNDEFPFNGAYDYMDVDYADLPAIDYNAASPQDISPEVDRSSEDTIIYDKDIVDDCHINIPASNAFKDLIPIQDEIITSDDDITSQISLKFSSAPTIYSTESSTCRKKSEKVYTRENQDEIYVSDNDILSQMSLKLSSAPTFNSSESSSLQYSANSKKSKKDSDPLEKQALRLKKQEDRERKKEKLSREKALKTQAAAKQKNLKPEECIKLLTVHIGTSIVNSPVGCQILPVLQQSDIKYCVTDSAGADTIKWTKLVKDHMVDEHSKLVQKEHTRDEEQLLYIMDWSQVASLIATNALLSHVEHTKRLNINKKLTLLLIGLEKYFNSQKNEANRNYKATVSGSQPAKKRKGEAAYFDVPKLSEEELEMALTELQLFESVNFRWVETPEELAATVLQFTRAISQVEYKQDKYNREASAASWFAKADGKSCVRVDKDGNGLASLWQQQLCQFANVGLEAAQAIVAQYKSPQLLLSAYEKCTSISQGESLLEDISMRREAGILSSTRRIGPEISKKVYRFFTATDGDTQL